MEREARSEREPQARQAKQEREDRSKHCKRRRRRSTKKNKNHHEQDSKSIETASPDIRLKKRAKLEIPPTEKGNETGQAKRVKTPRRVFGAFLIAGGGDVCKQIAHHVANLGPTWCQLVLFHGPN